MLQHTFKIIVGTIIGIGLTTCLNLLWADVIKSSHNFGNTPWNSQGSICEPCHGNHHGRATPMWGRDLSRAVYTMHAQKTLLGTLDAQPAVSSRLCLSCHDGTQPLENFGHKKGGRTYMPVRSRIGPDLRLHHPVSVKYLTSTKLLSPNTPSGLGHSISRDLLKGGKVECLSCHDVHNRYGNEKMLIKKKDQLCQTCHIQTPVVMSTPMVNIFMKQK